ncbi:hypothetical protein DdX_09365 [Ditylenchus destructor]|uniref:Uncharacterized protein n=1 Tax=Ditylenchus destructor TaxID=166010 RepID=A0AAD4N0X7_9BILA|nr:hypothetical protein DdX_09365 [Ditylenchus destructor]
MLGLRSLRSLRPRRENQYWVGFVKISAAFGGFDKPTTGRRSAPPCVSHYLSCYDICTITTAHQPTGWRIHICSLRETIFFTATKSYRQQENDDSQAAVSFQRAIHFFSGTLQLVFHTGQSGPQS